MIRANGYTQLTGHTMLIEMTYALRSRRYNGRTAHRLLLLYHLGQPTIHLLATSFNSYCTQGQTGTGKKKAT